MNRIGIAVLLGVGAAALAFFLLPRSSNVPLLENRREYSEYSVGTEKETSWAPVQLWWEAPPDVQDRWRAKKAERFTLTRGEAFSGNTHVPREKIREFLDERVSRGEVEYVIVFATKGTRWGEIFPVLDECRKSRVRIVLLNQYES